MSKFFENFLKNFEKQNTKLNKTFNNWHQMQWIWTFGQNNGILSKTLIYKRFKNIKNCDKNNKTVVNQKKKIIIYKNKCLYFQTI